MRGRATSTAERRKADEELLRKLVVDHAGELGEREAEKFAEMLASLEGGEYVTLSTKQRSWARGRLEEIDPPPPKFATGAGQRPETSHDDWARTVFGVEQRPLAPPGRRA